MSCPTANQAKGKDMTVDLDKRPTYTDSDLHVMVLAYLECALWSSLGDDGEPLDRTHDVEDLAAETIYEAQDDCVAFVEYVGTQITGIDPVRAGHDFWLTRNHHGAGFWDRGLGAVGDSLTIAAHTFGGVDLYVGDDGQVYSS
jgi:hypothetical protein